VAYLVPNLNHEEVKRAAIDSMFQSSRKIFGNTPSIQQIESKVPEQAAIEASDGENYDQYIDGTYIGQEEESPGSAGLQDDGIREQDFYCDKCGEHISQKVWDYSVGRFGRPLCYKCQKKLKDEQKGGVSHND